MGQINCVMAAVSTSSVVVLGPWSWSRGASRTCLGGLGLGLGLAISGLGLGLAISGLGLGLALSGLGLGLGLASSGLGLGHASGTVATTNNLRRCTHCSRRYSRRLPHQPLWSVCSVRLDYSCDRIVLT